MNNSKISVRYAKAVFSLACERHCLDDIYRDFKLIRMSLFGVPEYKEVIANPTVKPDDKKQLLATVYFDKVHPLTRDFINFVVAENREMFLLDMAWNVEDMYRKAKNIKEVTVTTAVSVSADMLAKMSSVVAEAYQSQVELHAMVDPSIIGGLKVRIADRQLDLSVKTQLEEIRKSLKQQM